MLTICLLFLKLTVQLIVESISHIFNLTLSAQVILTFKHFFPIHHRNTIIGSIITSVLDYEASLYGKAAASTLKPLNAVYNLSLRFVTGDPYNTHHYISTKCCPAIFGA